MRTQLGQHKGTHAFCQKTVIGRHGRAHRRRLGRRNNQIFRVSAEGACFKNRNVVLFWRRVAGCQLGLASPVMGRSRTGGLSMRRRDFGLGAMALAGMLPAKWSFAQTRAESLRILSEAGPNSFDPIGVGVNRNAIQLHWNAYDRLVAFGTKNQPDGTLYYDYFNIVPELAERFELSDGGATITFFLRKDAVFHDGTPVTAADVKWSLDRVVASPIGKSQFSTGSMTSPDQFVVVDE